MPSNDRISDKLRLNEILRLGLHDKIDDHILNEYVKKASEELELPIALVSIVFDGIQQFSASHGLDGWLKEMNSTPIEWSFCANSVKTTKPFVVEDAETHELVRDNPLVTADGVKCYAGTPLITKNNQIIGNLCVIGTEPRKFTEEEISKLEQFSELVMQRLEERIQAK